MARYAVGNIKGPKGEDGVSPTATVTQLTTGARITITDSNGTTTAEIRNGVDADGNNIDLSPYATNARLDSTVNKLVSKDEIEDLIEENAPVTSVNGMTGDVIIATPDTTGYATQSWVTAQIASAQSTLNDEISDKQDALTAGSGIAIVNNVISATGGGGGGENYFAGNGINIDNNNYISVNTSVIATKQDLAQKQNTLTAGDNVSIQNGVISATDTTYSAGTGINIDSNNVISATGGGSGPTYTAGDGIDISNNQIAVDNTVLRTGTLATVATSGSYNDLINKPNLATVATSGSYNDLSNKPTIPVADGTTIVNNNGIWSTVGGGGGTSIATVADISNITATEEAAILSVWPPQIIKEVQETSNAYYTTEYSLISRDNSKIGADTAYYMKGLRGISASVDKTVFNEIIIINNNYGSLSVYNDSPKNMVPFFSTAQNGYVLGVDSGNLTWVTNGSGSSYTAGSGINISNDEISVDNTVVALQSDIPTVPTNVSAFTNDAGYITAAQVPSELPSYAVGDAGKVLSVNSTATGIEWATGGGGGSYTPSPTEVEGGYTMTSSQIADNNALKLMFDAAYKGITWDRSQWDHTPIPKVIKYQGRTYFAVTWVQPSPTVTWWYQTTPNTTLLASAYESISWNQIKITYHITNQEFTEIATASPDWYPSSGGTTYTAGTGLNLSNNEFSVDTTTIQEKLTAGTGISISNGVISVDLAQAEQQNF